MAILKEYLDEVRTVLDEFPEAGRLKKVGLGVFAIIGLSHERSFEHEVAAYPFVDSALCGLSHLALVGNREELQSELKEILDESTTIS